MPLEDGIRDMLEKIKVFDHEGLTWEMQNNSIIELENWTNEVLIENKDINNEEWFKKFSLVNAILNDSTISPVKKMSLVEEILIEILELFENE